MDFLISSLYSCRLCGIACVSAKDLPVQSKMLSVYLFFGPLLLCLHSTIPCSITLVRLSDLVTCPHHFSFCRFTVVRRFSYGPMCYMMVFRTKIPCRDSKEKRFTTTQELHAAVWVPWKVLNRIILERLKTMRWITYVTHLDETSRMSAEFVFRYGPKCMGGLILPILVLLHL